MNNMMPETDGPYEDIKWANFWETPGIIGAEVIAGRLRTEGIPALVWQQSAGTAMGLTYGPMGRGHVMVPEDQLEAARQIMASDPMLDEDDGEIGLDEEDIQEEDGGWFSKGILTLTALAMSPLGVAAAFIVAALFGGEDDERITCPDCDTEVEPDEIEIKRGWYVCPECRRTVFLKK